MAGWRGYLQQLGWWLAHRLGRGPERVLARQHDALGELRVTQAGELRYLYFGEETEQSCALIGNPAWLEYDYTRAMLLAGFWLPQIERALALGLGAGSLVSAVLQHLQPAQMRAVELRPGVVELARRWFALPDVPELQVVVTSAEQYMESLTEPVDLLMLDLYLEDGIAGAQLHIDFLQQCHAALRPGGLMVVNQWQQGSSGKPYAVHRLRELFGERYLQVEVVEGNIILFIPQSGELPLDRQAMNVWADRLAPQLGYSLRPYIEVMRRAG
ncbi:Spermidine synthase [Halopseudomonas pachastrellae]|uniref:spermidine synthase n=1 Tax=Halopseudomonas pachastrellae TaxID=254161 RepID=UPI0008EF4B63|nr:methyltransferase domain-containing protein [Halopseudomonas pachastrellae]SFM91683.1 Spermidine synthase [Halopseudomonas pachastrellae]